MDSSALTPHIVLGMKELLRSNDLVTLSYAMHLLDEADIGYLLLDSFTSAMEGSIGAIPRRLMVDETSLEDAKRVLGNGSLTIGV